MLFAVLCVPFEVPAINKRVSVYDFGEKRSVLCVVTVVMQLNPKITATEPNARLVFEEDCNCLYVGCPLVCFRWTGVSFIYLLFFFMKRKVAKLFHC
jgi:hypothetical protein